MFRGRRAERCDERQEGRETPGAGGAATRYQLRQRMLAIGADFWIENEAGQRVFKVDGEALRARRTLILEDDQGRELCIIQERLLRVRGTMPIEGPRGETLATVKKALLTPVRDLWTIRLGAGPEIAAQGNVLYHEYTLGAGRDKVAEVSKQWFRLRDSYGVAVEPGQDAALILAVTLLIDMMAHSGR